MTAKTIEQLVAEEEATRLAWEETAHHKGFTVAQLRRVFDRIANPANWKAPWAAVVPHEIVGAVLAAVEFFHADRAELIGVEQLTGRVIMQGKGYQA